MELCRAFSNIDEDDEAVIDILVTEGYLIRTEMIESIENDVEVTY